jgi:tetratricopeptide (TPR) repeat protein
MKRRQRWILLALIVAVALGTGTYVAWPILFPPPLPAVDLTGVDREIALAIAEARQAVYLHPDSAETYGKLGMVLLVHGFDQAAEVCLEQAQRRDPNDPRWPYHRATAVRHQLSRACALMEQAAERAGDDPPSVRLRLGELYLESGQLQQAKEQFQRILERIPGQPRARLGLARVALEEDRPAEGLRLLEGLQRQSAARLRTALYQRLGDHANAEKAQAMAETLPADLPWPDPFLEELAQLRAGKRHRLQQLQELEQQGKRAEALALGRRIEKIHPDVYWLVEARIYRDRGLREEAIRCYRRVLQLDPDSLDARLELVEIYRAAGQLAEARTELQQLLEREPGHGPARLALGQCEWSLGNRSAAVEHLRRALACMPLSIQAHEELARMLTESGQAEEAARLRRQAERLRTNRP